MASGVGVSDEVQDLWTAMQSKKKYSFLTFKISDDERSIVADLNSGEKTKQELENLTPEEQEQEYEKLCTVLKDASAVKQCRYALFDLGYDLGEHGKRNKIILILWCPENATVKQKMLYTSSKDALKKKLSQGIGAELQANDVEDLDYAELSAKVRKGH